MSFKSSKVDVLQKQLEVQEVVLKHGDPLLESVASGDFEVDMGEAIKEALVAMVVPATGNVTSIAVSKSENKLVIAQADFTAGKVIFKYVI